MKRTPIAGLVALAAAMIVTPSLAQTTEDAITAETVLARVNGTEITAGHLRLMRDQLPQQYQGLPPEQVYQGLIQQAISQDLLSQSLDAVPGEVAVALENAARAMRADAVLNWIGALAATEEAIKAAYAERYGGMEPSPEYQAAHILVKTEAEAAALRAKIDADTDFAALAREHSTGPSAPQGGDLGWFGSGEMVPAFETAVAALSPGVVSEPVETQFGWHLIKLLDRRVIAPPTLAEARDEMTALLRRAAIEARLGALREAGEVTATDLPETLDFLADPSLFHD